MINRTPLTVGIDVGGPKKGFHAVALQGTRLVEKLRTSDASEVVRWCLHHGAVAVAVDAPCQWRRPASLARAAERELAGDRISSFSTPTEERARGHPFYTWMLAGEAMFAALRRDYPLFDGSPPTGRVSLETFPQAVACALAGEIVSAQTKGVVRRTLIAQAGLPVAEFRNIDEIDAALCSIAAASLVSGTFRAYGDLAGGFIVVPKRPD